MTTPSPHPALVFTLRTRACVHVVYLRLCSCCGRALAIKLRTCGCVHAAFVSLCSCYARALVSMLRTRVCVHVTYARLCYVTYLRLCPCSVRAFVFMLRMCGICITASRPFVTSRSKSICATRGL